MNQTIMGFWGFGVSKIIWLRDNMYWSWDMLTWKKVTIKKPVKDMFCLELIFKEVSNEEN